jgi:hypothetical protein
MVKGRCRVLSIILAILLVFTSFPPIKAFGLTVVSWGVEFPDGYDLVSGSVSIHEQGNMINRNYYATASGNKIVFNNPVSIQESRTYVVEGMLQFTSSSGLESLSYFDSQHISGTDLAQVTTFTLPESGKVMSVNKMSIPLPNFKVQVVSPYVNEYDTAGSYDLRASKILTDEEKLTFSVSGSNFENQGFFVNQSVQINPDEVVNFSEAFIGLVPLDFQGAGTFEVFELVSEAFSSVWTGYRSNQTKWFVTPGSYSLAMITNLEIPNGVFSAGWGRDNVEIMAPVTLPMPGLLDSVQSENLYWNPNSSADLFVDFFSNGYRFGHTNNSKNSVTLSTKLEVKAPDGSILVTEDYPSITGYMNFTLPERVSGVGEIIVSIHNGEELLAKTSMPFELQDQADTAIHGLVVTAEDEKGNPLQSGSVTVMERINPQVELANFGYNRLELRQVYRTNIEDHKGVKEAFIPNAYLLSGREYEIIVEGYTSQEEKILYQKSLTADNLTTLHLAGNQLTELQIQTDKRYQEGHFSLSAFDTASKQIVSWPYMVNANKTLYVDSDYSLLLNAQIINTESDVGYFYSELLDLGDSPKQNIQLDAMDKNMTKVEAPAGFEKAQIGVQSIWSTENKASTFYLSNPFQNFDLGISLRLLGTISSQGYQYDFYKDIYDKEAPINVDMTGEFAGWLYQGYTHPTTKEVMYYTEYRNPNGVVLTYIGPKKDVVSSD